MRKRIGGKLVGAALSVAVLSGCTTSTEEMTVPTHQQEQERPDTTEERFTDAARYITHIVTCIAEDERSKMANLDINQLDNSTEAFGPNGTRGVQPMHVNIRRGVGPVYEEGSWAALYRKGTAPGTEVLYAVQALGDVPHDSDFWKDASSEDLNIKRVVSNIINYS